MGTDDDEGRSTPVEGTALTTTSSSVIEVEGPASAALTRAVELRQHGWNVAIRGTRLSQSCEMVWCLEVERDSA